jgi:hypothetical protein
MMVMMRLRSMMPLMTVTFVFMMALLPRLWLGAAGLRLLYLRQRRGG